jgi:chromosome segregation ATPase
VSDADSNIYGGPQ